MFSVIEIKSKENVIFAYLLVLVRTLITEYNGQNTKNEHH